VWWDQTPLRQFNELPFDIVRKIEDIRSEEPSVSEGGKPPSLSEVFPYQ
jgi:hypothetical protein